MNTEPTTNAHDDERDCLLGAAIAASSKLNLERLRGTMWNLAAMSVALPKSVAPTFLVPPGTVEKLQREVPEQAVVDDRNPWGKQLHRMYGCEIVQTPLARQWVQVRFPRSKKKRIRKKWAKREENWAYRDQAFIVDRHALGEVRRGIQERMEKEFLDAALGR